MANEKRLIDANALQFKPEPVDNIMNGVLFLRGRGVGKTVAMVGEALRCMIDNAPTIDAVEVVRCKECEYRHDSCFAGKGNIYCDYHHKYFGLDDFCSYGERRTDNG